MEEDVLYGGITNRSTTPSKVGKLRDAAFDPLIHLTDPNHATWNATTNPYEWETKIEVLRCPSYAGEESVTPSKRHFLSGTGRYQAGSPIAAGNYIAMASTHFLGPADYETWRQAPPRRRSR